MKGCLMTGGLMTASRISLVFKYGNDFDMYKFINSGEIIFIKKMFDLKHL